MASRGFQIAASLAATLLLSGLSWKYFESPILRLKSRFESLPGETADMKKECPEPVRLTSPPSPTEP